MYLTYGFVHIFCILKILMKIKKTNEVDDFSSHYTLSQCHDSERSDNFQVKESNDTAVVCQRINGYWGTDLDTETIPE